MSAPSSLGPTTAALGIFADVAGTAQANSAYNSAGDAALSSFEYNSKLIDLNLNRQLDSIAAELKTHNSKQRAQIAKSNISLTSKSSLVLMNEAISNFEKESVLAKENAALQKKSELFKAKQQRDVFRTQATGRTLEGISSAITSTASLFESLSA